MNDRFKFRCYWEDGLKEMFYYDTYYMPKLVKGEEKTAHIMQCTGLKDKNGKLIYEGDILKCYYIDSDTEKEEFDLMSVVYKDEFCAFGLIGFKTSSFEDFVNTDYIAEEHEVIGNIYENKELLNDK